MLLSIGNIGHHTRLSGSPVAANHFKNEMDLVKDVSFLKAYASSAMGQRFEQAGA